MNELKPGDMAWLDEWDALSTVTMVKIVKIHKGGNVIVDEGEGYLRETCIQRLTKINAGMS